MSGGQGNNGSNGQDPKTIVSLDGVVTGTSANDEMLPGYTDQDGDQIDGSDGINDTILGLDGDDTINAGDGDDLAFGGSGNDSIEGGSGNDTLIGDVGDLNETLVTREALKWSEVPDPDGPGAIDDDDDLTGGFTVNTGNVNVTFSVLSQTSGSLTQFADNTQNVDGIESADDSSLFSDHDTSNGESEYELTFDTGVSNVEFRINDIDNDSGITILAYDAEGVAIPVTLEAGASLDLVDVDGLAGFDRAESQGGNGLDTSEEYSLKVNIAGPVSRIVILHDQDGNVDSGVNVTDVYFDAPLLDLGDPGDDTLIGGDGDDLILGEEGDDSLTGGDGADTILGGDDRDVIIGGTAGDVVDGGDGGDDFDTLDLRGQGDVSIVYTTQDEENGYVFLDEFGEYVEFHDIENLLVDGERDPDGIVEGSLTAEVIDELYDGDPDGDFVDNGDNIFPGGDPDSDVIVAKSGDDTIIAGEDRDLIFAGDGDDNVDGGAGDDTAFGGDGSDYLDGADANDALYGQDGDDYVTGGDGDDFVSGGSGDDQVVGDAGDDTLEGNEGTDLVDGGSGNDLIDGGDGDDFLDAGGGNDTVRGGAGNDNITGNPGDDVLFGGDGDDTIQANDGTDVIDGGAGNDFISTGPGEDTATGGDDRDTILVVGQNNQFVDGSEGGDDFDTLIVRGNAEIEEDAGNPENGVVYYLDEFGDRTGITTTYINIENVIIDPNDGIDGVVEGTSGDDLIDASYTDDPEGDLIDNFDALDNFLDEPGNSTVPSSFFEDLGGTPRGDNRDAVDAGDGDDTVLSGDGDDIVHGGEGNDSIDGGLGFDDLAGDEGDDTIFGGFGNDKIFGGADNDVLDGGAQGDTLVGNEGDDLLIGGEDADVLYGNEDNDTIEGGTGGDTIFGGEGNDSILGGLGDDIISTGEGSNFADAGLGNNQIIAGAGNDTLIGGEGNDSLDAGGGDDSIVTGGGNDTIIAGTGQDTVDAGAGDDLVRGGDPSLTGVASVGQTPDNISGGDGDDTLEGGSGADTISGGDDNDLIFGGIDGDDLRGGDGNDTVYGDSDLGFVVPADIEQALTLEPGNDVITGGDGEDVLYGQDGADDISGGDGNDLIVGGTSGDTLTGGDGNDTIYAGDDGVVASLAPALDDGLGDSIVAGDGDDRIIGADGADTISGGEGNDTMVGFGGADEMSGGDDQDVFGGGVGDTVVGGEGGDDFDTLVVSGLSTVEYVNDDPSTEAGTVTFYDDDLNVTGTMEFSEIEQVLAVDPNGGGGGGIGGGVVPNSIEGVVEGTDTGELIDLAYTGDPDGDLVDGDDAVFPLTGEQDVILGFGGDDTIFGREDSDIVLGGEGNDEISGNAGNDGLQGGIGDDTLSGDEGRDIVSGGVGDDVISGNSDLVGDGGDLLFGGDDADTFNQVGIGDVVDGGEGGDDNDTLNLIGAGLPGGSVSVAYTGGDPASESGIVTYFDDQGVTAGTSEFSNIENVVICFTPGTKIATPKGERLVETLREGDRVITRDNGIQEIRWAGQRTVSGPELKRERHLNPVLVRAGSLGNGLPERDMMLSPNHRVLVANDRTALYFEDHEVLVAAKHLTGMEGVDVVVPNMVTYIHFMFDQHEVVLSDGAWTESFQPGDYSLKGLGNAQRAEIFELFPQMKAENGGVTYNAARRSLKKHEVEILLG